MYIHTFIHSIIVLVCYPRENINFEDNQNILIKNPGEQIYIHCTAPVSVPIWIKDHKLMQVEPVGKDLVINKAEGKDSGNYSCSSKQIEAEVFVGGKFSN